MDIQVYIVSKIGIDKVLHFAYGGWFSSYFHDWRILVSAFIIGLIKELIDKFVRKSTFCYKDLFWTTMGGVFQYTITRLILIYEYL